jgi:hypothetical protein
MWITDILAVKRHETADVYLPPFLGVDTALPSVFSMSSQLLVNIRDIRNSCVQYAGPDPGCMSLGIFMVNTEQKEAEALYVNASLATERYRLINRPVVMDLDISSGITQIFIY